MILSQALKTGKINETRAIYGRRDNILANVEQFSHDVPLIIKPPKKEG
jgi:hypothetical protein